MPISVPAARSSTSSHDGLWSVPLTLSAAGTSTQIKNQTHQTGKNGVGSDTH